MIGEATTPRESHQLARPRAAFDQAVSYPQEFKKFLHLAGLKMSARFLRAGVMSGARRTADGRDAAGAAIAAGRRRRNRRSLRGASPNAPRGRRSLHAAGIMN
jgi:hypothetical protein